MTDTPRKRVNRRLQLVDPETGEVEDRDASWEEPGKRGRRGRKMTFAMIETSAEGIARLRLSAQEWQVLMQIIATTNPESHEARIGVTEIAANLDILPPAASRTLGNLAKRRVVFRLARGRYRTNTHIAYRGSAEKWGEAYYQDPEPIWEV